MAQENDSEDFETVDPQPLRAVANIVLDAMRNVPPEVVANSPKDGAAAVPANAQTAAAQLPTIIHSG